MEISQPAFLFYIHLTYLPIFHSPILTLWYVTFLDKMCSLKKSFHNYCKYEIKNILAQLWPRTDVYARKPLAQKYMNVVPWTRWPFYNFSVINCHAQSHAYIQNIRYFMKILVPICRTLLCDSFYFKVWRNKTTKVFNLIGKFNRVFFCGTGRLD